VGHPPYGYDTENNLTSITDALNRVTGFEYDARGRVTKTTFPSTLYETYNYDNLGNLVSKVDRKNNTTTYFYDALNRMYKKVYQDNSEVNFTYDNLGRLTDAIDATGTYHLDYDNMGRLTGTTTQYAFLSGQTFTMGYGYDPASNRTSMTDPQSGVTNYVYDTLNRLESLTNPQSQQFTFGYDNLSRRTSLTRPNNVTTSYSYDSLSRLLSVLHKDSTNAVIDGATYTVDNVGNRMSKQNHLAGVTENYTYDAIYQLTQVTQAAATTEWFNYDKVGNRTASYLAASYTVNSSNQLTADSNASYTYDNNGNTLTKTVGTDVTTYGWDLENRLTSVQLPNGGGTVSYKYDPFGRRICRSGPSGTTIWNYDGPNIIEERDGTGTLVARYTQGAGIDEPLAMLRGGSTYNYEQDGLGSVTSLTGVSGSVAESYTYDSYGKVLAGGTTVVNPFRYTGREWDGDAGIYYYRARYYEPTLGKFLSEDTLRFVAGQNFFAYVDNSPARFRDSSGHSKYDDIHNAAADFDEKTAAVLVLGFKGALRAADFATTALHDSILIGNARNHIPIDEKHNGRIDALRHCLWSCRLTKEFGESKALMVLENHELVGSAKYGPIVQSDAEAAMDRANNAEGVQCGNDPNSRCDIACWSKLTSGLLHGMGGGRKAFNDKWLP
jgi:RHS repeat-associated protein